MGNLQTFSLARENHRVITDNISGSNHAEPYGSGLARAGTPLSRVNRYLRKLSTPRRSHRIPQSERRSRGRINLVAMMGFHNFNVSAVPQGAGCRFRES